jgi:hypothetical protein
MNSLQALQAIVCAENKNFTAPEQFDWENSRLFVSGEGDNRKRLTDVLEQICHEMNVPDIEYIIYHHHNEHVSKSRTNGFSYTFEHVVVVARNNDQFVARVTHI